MITEVKNETIKKIIELLNLYPGIGIVGLMEKSNLDYNTVFNVLVELSLADMISFRLNGYVLRGYLKNECRN